MDYDETPHEETKLLETKGSQMEITNETFYKLN